MIHCDNVQPHLSALLDGELGEEESGKLLGHINQCSACMREWERLRVLDDQLRSTLHLHNVDSRVALIEERLASKHAASPSSATAFSTGAKNWLEQRSGAIAIILAIAAMLLAVLFLPPLISDSASRTESPQIADSNHNVIARLTRATGIVEIRNPGETAWNQIQADSGFEFPLGARVKTAESVLCEIETKREGKIRLSESGEMVLQNPHQLELVQGQLWLLAPEDAPIQIQMVTAPTASIASFTCPSGSEFQCRVGTEAASCESVSMENVATQMAYGSDICTIAPGETISIDSADGRLNRISGEASDTKVWQLPLLAVGTLSDGELSRSMNVLLAPIGRTKARHLHEQQIRALGPPGAVPLLTYAAGELSGDQLELRRTAVSLAKDLADGRSIELLQRLSKDSDAYISSQAKATLERIARESR